MTAVRQVTPVASVLLAPNPGPMTLEGTNTWVLRAPGSEGCVVVDPGPLHEGHLAAVAACGPVEVVLLTHGHADHSEGAARLAALTGAPVRALDPAQRLGGQGRGGQGRGGKSRGGQGLAEGDVVEAAGLEVGVLATPGHTSDSLSFVLDGAGEGSATLTGAVLTGAVLTGDTVLGRGTTVVAHPDGVLADYLESLRRLEELGEMTVLPGHGPELPSAATAAGHYLRHRERRLEQVRGAVEAREAAGPGAVTAREVVESVYADVDRALWPAAELSVRAQLAYLRGERA